MDKNQILNQLLNAGFRKLDTSDSARNDRHLMYHSKTGLVVTVGEFVEFKPVTGGTVFYITTQKKLDAVIALSECDTDKSF
jgi:hypothetical protein